MILAVDTSQDKYEVGYPVGLPILNIDQYRVWYLTVMYTYIYLGSCGN